MHAFDSIPELAAAVRSGTVPARRIVEETLSRIEALNGSLNAYREIYPEPALQAADAVDRAVSANDDPGPLAGIPVAVKDNIATAFGRTSCGSRILAEYRSPYSATAVLRLEAAGAIVIGKTNCDEFGMGSSTEHCAFGPARNPWDPSRVPGGSSGGSAAAVSAGLCAAALGSDTGGSIRQPASLCGIVGVKPTYGRVSRYGLTAYGSSLDQIGPMARSVTDAAMMLQVMAGPDRHDSTCADRPVPDYLASIDQPVEGLRVGVPRQYVSPDNDPAVNEVVQRAVETLRRVGATIIDLDLPMTDYGISTYYVIAPAEASSNLARYDGIRYGHRATLEQGEGLLDLYARTRAEGFGPEVQRRVMLGTYLLSAGYHDQYYKRALQVRRLIKQDFDRALSRCDVLLGPTSPTPAFRLGEKTDPLSMYLCDVYTANTNIAGICAISVPAGFAEVDGRPLPIGVQLQCQVFNETTLFRAARLLEANAHLAHRHPHPPASATA